MLLQDIPFFHQFLPVNNINPAVFQFNNYIGYSMHISWSNITV